VTQELRRVVAFGSPRSQTFLMTQGIISKVEDRVLLGDFLIDHGNSGGPLLNMRGEVIGINRIWALIDTSKDPTNLGFIVVI